jgi:nucleoside-diphosphate-sugar epimerase
VARSLVNQNYEVYCLTRPNSNLWRLSNITNLTILPYAPKLWPKVIKELNPNGVISSDWDGVQIQARNASIIQRLNLRRVSKIAKATIKVKANFFITIGSQSEIDLSKSDWSEEAPDNPNSTYGKVKIKLRKRLDFLFSKTETRFVWARVFSVYGPLEISPTLIVNEINFGLQGKKLDLLNPIKDWNYIYAEDFANAIIHIIRSDKIMGVVNIVDPNCQRLEDFINEIRCQLTSKIKGKPEKGGENWANPSKVAPSKLLDNGWQPKVPFDVGIGKTINWHMGGNTNSEFGNLPGIELSALPQILEKVCRR